MANTDRTPDQPARNPDSTAPDGAAQLPVGPENRAGLPPSMQETHLPCPPLPIDIAAWLLWLMCRDLAQGWRRNTRLQYEEAVRFAFWMHSALPVPLRTPMPVKERPKKKRL